MTKILCYIRPWNKSQFLQLADAIWDGGEVIHCSEHKSLDKSGLHSYYYKALSSGKCNDSFCNILENEIVDDIIIRCRLLRVLDKCVAVKHVAAMSDAINKVLVKTSPDYVLSLTVDSFILDILRILCAKKQIKFIGLVPTFVNGFFRVTARGERTIRSDIDAKLPAELRKELLDDAYTPNFNKRSQTSPLRTLWLRWVSNIIRVPLFFLKRCVSGDWYNYHYWSSQVVAKTNAMYFPPIRFGNSNWIAILKNSSKTKLYIPLQMYPECTVDYWCENPAVIDYYKTLDEFINKHSEDFLVVVKEHPSVLGSRPRNFYRNMVRNESVLVVPTYEFSNTVVELVDAVLVWTGTVGFEAILRGKPVLTFTDTYYSSGCRIKVIEPDVSSMELKNHINAVSALELSQQEQLSILGALSSQLYRGKFKNDGSWSANNLEDLDDMQIMAKSLRSEILINECSAHRSMTKSPL